MKKSLIIFDNYINLNSTLDGIKADMPETIELLALTSDNEIVEKLIALLNDNNISYKFLNSADMINMEVAALKESICSWTYLLGETSVYGMKVKDIFLFNKENISSWWFTLIHEKNTVKSDIYLKICQYKTIEKLIANNNYDFVSIGVIDPRLLKAVLNYCRNKRISCKCLHLKSTSILKSFIYKFSLGIFLLRSILMCCRFLYRKMIAFIKLGNISYRIPKDNSLLWVNYFPSVDKEKSKNGIFINKYAPALQKKLNDMKVSITWLFMYISFDKFTYKESVDLAKSFSLKGEKVFFLEEFIKFVDIFKALFIWFIQMIRCLFILPKLKKAAFLDKPIGIECVYFAESIWIESFYGPSLIEGILYYFCYKNVFKKINKLKSCLYYCEMLAWEKALNAAKIKYAPKIITIGFQHAILPKNLYNYFYDKNEINNGLPKPDIIACNGKFTCSLLKESGFTNLNLVEAARHTYIDDILKIPKKSKSMPILFVAGSIDKNEMVSLIRLLYNAFPKANADFEIWLKSHPCLDFLRIFNNLGINPSESGYKICSNNVSECFTQANIALVPSSSVALEAAAFGCEVIVPLFPDSIIMNPLLDFNFPCHLVTCPKDLRSVMHDFTGSRVNNNKDNRVLINDYWKISSKLNEWEKLINSVYESN